MTEGAQEETAFAYLTDIRRRFIQRYDYDAISGFSSYQLSDFEKVLKQLMVIKL
jgi:hypothetical protein